MGVFLGRWSLRPRWSAASAASASRITPTARRRSGARTGTPCGTSTPSRTRAGWGWRSAWRQASGPRAISGAWRRAHGTDPRRRPDDLEVPLAVPGRLPAELDPRRRGARPGRGRDLVHECVRQQVACGPIFSLPSRGLEERVAQQLVDLVPCAESVRFIKTGSEATEAAARVARAATGRGVILTGGD